MLEFTFALLLIGGALALGEALKRVREHTRRRHGDGLDESFRRFTDGRWR